jgi:hypothetical protein
MTTREVGPFCQCCGRQLDTSADFGTTAAGIHINDYCRHCYDKGQFTADRLPRASAAERRLTATTLTMVRPWRTA